MVDGHRPWRREHREIEEAMRGDGDRHLNKRDPVALAVGLINLLAIIGGWAWYGGRLEQRVTILERDQEMQRAAIRDKVDLDAVQTTQIAVLQQDVKSVKETVERIDKKIPERTR